ncbi:Ltp family lipoprotein [Clostridium perfringens]|uniref:Ltp family lipoprotein n=2 Tax=Clostridium perfringens TaxID=1502 RepID=UPI0013E35E97|nr:Ltp family lipoprotein [Clostridium perfringens]EJT5919422.1 Ltp family lipoprotein [Clostridium perfringens]EJT5935291.1 Ltp family lipoprotein [Clostridium perfringens]EJT6164543.1 Ltp family lipoprotein [Clostridium perfringens]EJT6656009.1 Ltp family lipoprotein [Clostridium perfringens]ELC8433477.1 Ltp family lipoprotein [Clostridium perfringens]
MSKMKKCKVCSKEIASSAKSCPGCGAKNKKAIYKRPWFIVLAIIIILGAIGGSGHEKSTVANNKTISEVDQNQDKEISNNQGGKKEVLVKANEEKLEKKEEKVEEVPKEYKSALRKAKVYSDTMSMSKEGLYDQLTSEYGEKFSAEAAQYAVDNLNANWKENALKKAKVYQETMAMSPSAIYDQLVSEYGEKFTAEEAKYAVDNL